MADAPRDYIEAMVQAVVGIEIEIDRLVGKFKLSQNKEKEDREGAIQGARERGGEALAKAMQESMPAAMAEAATPAAD
jgi:transcriptional regulator